MLRIPFITGYWNPVGLWIQSVINGDSTFLVAKQSGKEHLMMAERSKSSRSVITLDRTLRKEQKTAFVP